MGISDAVDVSAKARVVGIKTQFKDLRTNSVVLLPQRVALVGQGSSAVTYDTTKRTVSSADEVGSTYGQGSPLHLAARQLLPANGDGLGTVPLTIYPVVDDGSGVASNGDITPSGSATTAASYQVVVNNIKSNAFVISVGDSVATMVTSMVAAINAVLEMPIIAVDGITAVTFTSKWQGTSANDIVVSIEGPTSFGVSFALTQASGGLVNPDIQPALDQFGNIWETMVVSCLEVGDTTTLDLYKAHGEGRWGALVRKFYVAYTGFAPADVTAAIVGPDARKDDRINAQLISVAGADLPCVIAASQVVRIAVLANNNPPHDYGGRKASGLIAGADGSQFSYLERDLAFKGGSSTNNVKDGVVTISDVITNYHPAGETNPAYTYVVDIVKLQNIVFNLDLIFDSAEWNGAPLLPDDSATNNRSAKKPRHAVAAANSMIDSLAGEAILSDPDTAKANTLAEIDGGNPKRLNLSLTVQLSGNSNIISADLNFGFFFGSGSLA